MVRREALLVASLALALVAPSAAASDHDATFSGIATLDQTTGSDPVDDQFKNAFQTTRHVESTVDLFPWGPSFHGTMTITFTNLDPENGDPTSKTVTCTGTVVWTFNTQGSEELPCNVAPTFTVTDDDVQITVDIDGAGWWSVNVCETTCS